MAEGSDLGAALQGPFTSITTLDIRNDTAVSRLNDLAFSGVPLARELNLTGTDGLAVVSPAGRQVAAQFTVLSRWGGPPADTSLPIRWVQVALKTNVPADGSVRYELRLYRAPRDLPDPGSVRVSGGGGLYTVETGAATFELDPESPALLRAIRRGGVTIYRDAPGAGPHVIDGAGVSLAPRVDPGSFAIEEAGPVAVVARLRGHFTRAAAGCGHDLGFVVRLTFERASSDVGVQLHVVNECGDGHAPAGQLPNGAPWWNRVYPVARVAWSFPMTAADGAEAVAGGVGTAIHRGPRREALRVEQLRGRPGPVYRAARVSSDGMTLATAEYLERPFVALAGREHTSMLQMPWMRYREPQALAVEGSTLSMEIVSGPSVIGEAQGVWSFARLSIAGGGAADRALADLRDRGHAALERGLLVHVPVTYLDSTRVMLPLAPRGGPSDPLYRTYVGALNRIHDDTVRPGGSWDRQKMYGFTVWPDYSGAEDPSLAGSPAESTPASNYWSGTSAELKQWFVDGDPKWVWDFALPQEYTQLFTNYYNLGARSGDVPVDYRGGFTVVAGSRAIEGEAYRSGWGSDDYSYNQGSDEAYVVRPNPAVAERFAQAADTFLRRYGEPGVPASEQQRRDEGLQSLRIGRSQAQHLNALSYGAQFSLSRGGEYFRALQAVMNEYAADNLKGGVFCLADYGNDRACTALWGSYHFLALQFGAFADFLSWVGPDDPRGAAIARAIATTGELYYRAVTRAGPDGRIDPAARWYGALECTFTGGGTILEGCLGRETEEPVYAHERPAALAFVLFVARSTENAGMCLAAEAAFPEALASGLGYFASESGWNKGAAQSAHMIPHGIAAIGCAP